MKRLITSFLEVFEIAVIAIGAVFLIRTFLVQPFLVSGASMVPNFADGDYLLVDELTYNIREPERGEVAVFHYPQEASTFFIKRIIGLPGDRVVVSGDKVEIFNEQYPDGLILEESYLAGNIPTKGDVDVNLGEDEYFVLGDNRLYSFDSRSWGTLSEKNIVGLVRLRLWPPVTVFATPQYTPELQ